ncbi:MAG: PA0069 family radical SAM protein [Planctomycetaceae bacterium]
MHHGSLIDPPNRFERTHRESDLEQIENDPEFLEQLHRREIEYLPDRTRSIVTQNDSPDIPFRFSINPYRGCAHGCAYCYARNTHEYLGMNAGLDFETKIVVKHDAQQLFREFLSQDSWKPEPIVFSGVTDCYQPGERRFQLTRQCLEVAWECRQPIGMVTKNALVVRDLDLLGPMAERNLVHVFVSINSLDADLAREMEPRTSTPAARLRAVAALADAGVPVGVMAAPVIPGLNDSGIPAVLAAAQTAGARTASWVMLRLPLTVEPVFREWLERTQPLKAGKVLALLRQVRNGELNNSKWGQRMSGTGPIAEQIRRLFQVFAQKHNLSGRLPPLDTSQFVPPPARSGQLRLF